MQQDDDQEYEDQGCLDGYMITSGADEKGAFSNFNEDDVTDPSPLHPRENKGFNDEKEQLVPERDSHRKEQR